MINDAEALMELDKANLVVLPNVAEFGLVSKEERGVIPCDGQLPGSLLGMRGALARVSAGLGVAIDAPVRELARELEIAIVNRESSVVAGPAVGAVNNRCEL